MKVRLLLFAIALMLVSASMTADVRAQNAQDKTKSEMSMPMDDEMMKKWMEAATPGEHHKFLNQFVGKWDTVTRAWFGKDSKPSSEAKGTAEIKWVMEGRFLYEESAGQMMGMSFNSMNITGYDNFKKKFVVFHIDNMGTAIVSGEGSLDQTGKVLTFYGKMDEPTTGEHDKLVKFVNRIISKDKSVFEIYDLVGTPDEYKAAEISYTRK